MSFRIDITCTDCGKTARFTVDTAKTEPPDLDSISIDELELGVREWNVLAHANIRTVGELVRCDRNQLLHYQNFGRRSLNQLEDALQAFFRKRASSGSAIG